MGVVPGSRLRIQRSGEPQKTVLVRISKKRKIGISRHRWSGKWFEVPGLDEVVIVSPSLSDPMNVDVVGFNTEALIRTFDALDQLRNGPYAKERELNFPIFAALDPQRSDDTNDMSSNLIEKASWAVTVPLYEPLASNPMDPGGKAAPAPVASAMQPSGEGFIERVRREFAEINGVEISKVIVNFHIVG